MNQNEQHGFRYTYSAKEQAEIKSIREKYLATTAPQQLDRVMQIRRLDTSVTRSATVVSLCVGVISTLVMGLGMSLLLSELKALFGSQVWLAALLGILLGLVGVVGVISAYPLYQRITEKKRRAVAPEILRLTEEWMAENQ